jgi:hypothetical protein
MNLDATIQQLKVAVDEISTAIAALEAIAARRKPMKPGPTLVSKKKKSGEKAR